ncbi:T9SS C-terminal target domain-containing protein [Sphingobacteriales bacterium UPWRP_1]|nr:hypothetical protein BVG80_06935 [Sphingobacteriales bacterium TSM_CSM]PSJ78181.1 T9SS C-terminal target domain-containing protein [Sphingobacteriales bacterium UPWRP_1]
MKHVFLLLACVLVPAITNLYAGNDQKYNISVFKDQIRIDEPSLQAGLRHQTAWQQFAHRNGPWYAEFNTLTKLPMRAAGTPVTLNTSGSDADLAMYFVNSELKAFNLPAASFQLNRINNGRSLNYVQFTQFYQGLPVLGNGLSIRLNNSKQVVAFTADVFNNIAVNTQPAITPEQALQLSVADVPGNYPQHSTPALKVLPVPTPSGYEYKLVYDFTIKGNIGTQTEPVNFRIWMDAHNGTIYYRYNMVCSFDAEEAQSLYALNGQVTPNPNFAPQAVTIPHMRIRVGATDYYTDADGHLDYAFPPGIPATANGTAYLDGPFCRVYNGATGSTTPSFPVSIVPGGSEITVPNSVTSSQISGFYHVVKQHQFMKSWIPGLTTMDFPIITRVDRNDGNCNAFYDGGVNFYAQGGGCFATSLFSDIIFHEYGHGINYYFYDYKGGNFDNGSLGEGYADVWAFAHTENPILSQGFNVGAINSFIRRYDQNPKVYPQDLTGEVHDNGEIIAGAWWDLGQQIGLQNMFTIFINSHEGVPMRPDGDEGTLYSDILFEALIADDDNGNLSDGTPNSIAIIDNFALHGIYLQISADIVHAEYPVIAPTDLAQINFTLGIDFNYLPFVEGVGLWYRTDRTQPFTYTNAVALTGGSTYTGFIPFLTAGTIVDYYLELEDNVGGVPLSEPYLANRASNPNIPFQMLVGYETLAEDNLFGTAANWTLGAPGDDATTGMWTIGSPIESYVNDVSMVQTGTDNTPDGNNQCAFTGNDTSGGAAGVNDVDDGKTTLTTKPFNLMQYDNPAFSFYRWYSNDQGANPGNDNWEVYISNNGGTTWVPVENTNVADHSWRLFALRVLDYVTLSPDVRLRFVASDNLIPGLDYEGGSLVEAAIDDFVLYEQADETQTGINNFNSAAMQVYPNPANDFLMVQLPQNGNAQVTMFNALGQQVYAANNQNGGQTLRINTTALPQGVYLLQATQNNQTLQQKVMVNR